MRFAAGKILFPYYLLNSAGKKDKRDPFLIAEILLLLILQSTLAHVVLILISFKTSTKNRYFSSALLMDHRSQICSLC